MDIKEARKQIDSIDSVLVTEFEKRLTLIKEIGKYKDEHHLPLIDEERDEIQVIVENDRLERRFRFRKVVDLLHVVEDHHDHDDHRDSEEVGAQELAEDIPVEDLESGEAEMRELSFHRGSSVTACGRVWRPSAPSRV